MSTLTKDDIISTWLPMRSRPEMIANRILNANYPSPSRKVEDEVQWPVWNQVWNEVVIHVRDKIIRHDNHLI